MIVPPIGPLDAKIAIVGEAPGAEEEIEGVPFVGSSGRLLNQMLAGAGIIRSQCFICNVVDVRPPANNFGVFYRDKERQDPSDSLIKAREILHSRLQRLKPNVVICLGDEALRAVTGKRSISKWRGSVISSPCGKVVPTYHPAYVMRLYSTRAVAELDLKKALRESFFPEIKIKERKIIVNPNFTDVIDWLRRPHKRLSVDIETTELITRCIGFACSSQEAICIPLMSNKYSPNQTSISLFGEGYGSPQVNSHWTLEEEFAILGEIKRVLEDPSIGKFLQNFPFDATILAREFGIQILGLEMDTMVAHHCLFSELPKGLDFLASLYTDIPYYSDYDASTDLETWVYNGKDCLATFEVAEKLEKELEEARLLNFYKLHCEPTMLALARCGNRGAPIDLKCRDELKTFFQSKLEKIEKTLKELTGEDFNPNSRIQMANYLHVKMGLPKQQNRKTGKETLNEEALERLASRFPNQTPFIEACLEYRGTVKIISTYLESTVNAKSRMETSYNATGTVNGRISSSRTLWGTGGNLQQVAKNEIRKMYCAPEGYTWIRIDLSQAEARVVAWRAKITTLINRFVRDPSFDIHRYVGSLIYKKAEIDVSYLERDSAKVGVHGGNYKLGPETASKRFKVPYQQVKDFLMKYRQIFPELPQWWREIEELVTSTRSLRSVLGRRRVFLDRIDEELFRSAIAFEPQSTVGDIINHAFMILELWMSEKIQLTLQVHDEIDFICKTEDVDESLAIVRRVVEVPLKFEGVDAPLIIPMEASIGKNWHELEDYDERVKK
jgi:uracil-DNA glycosylase family 4